MERWQTEQRAPTPWPPQVRSGARAGSVRRRSATRACARSLASSASGFVVGTTDDSPGEEVGGNRHRGNGEGANDGLSDVDHRAFLNRMSDSDSRASFRRGLEAMKKQSRTSANTALQNAARLVESLLDERRSWQDNLPGGQHGARQTQFTAMLDRLETARLEAQAGPVDAAQLEEHARDRRRRPRITLRTAHHVKAPPRISCGSIRAGPQESARPSSGEGV
jgi:hypothetical protein